MSNVNGGLPSFIQLIESISISKQITSDFFYFTASFEIDEDDKTIVVEFKEDYIILVLTVFADTNRSLATKLRHYAKKKRNSDEWGEYDNSYQFKNKFHLRKQYHNYDEFIEFYKMYLI